MPIYVIIDHMKIQLSANAIQNLVLMLDDCYRLDASYDDDHKIWGDFDCITIIQDLLSAGKRRSADGYVEVSQETIAWMEVAVDGLDDIDHEPTKHQLSRTTLQALVKSSKFDFSFA